MIKQILIDWSLRLLVSPLVLGATLLLTAITVMLYLAPITSDQFERSTLYVENVLGVD